MKKSHAIGRVIASVLTFGLVLYMGMNRARSPRPVPAVNTDDTNAGTTNLYIRAAISGAVAHVRADIASTTNTSDIVALRHIEQALTNNLK